MIELAVLVPVLNRPQNVAPLVESWLMSRAPGYLVFLPGGSDDEEWAECVRVSNDRVLVRANDSSAMYPARTWPQKINLGVELVQTEWYLLAADDVTFEEGWWEATENLRGSRNGETGQPISVIGTNDLANPRCIAGEHSTHTLIRGSYIREHGTIDEPGKAVHDGYHHWYVDDELKYTAMYRGVWAHCTDAHIAHHHPYFDPDVPMDDTYRLGEKHQAEDQALFIERAPLFGIEVVTQ